MEPHVHIGAIPFAVHVLYLVLALFALRFTAINYPDSTIGKAAAFLVG